MDITLIVTRPFSHYSIGDRITEPADVAATLASEHAHHVVAVKQPAMPGEE